MTVRPGATRWGFIGAGYVATRALAPAVHAATHATLQAVGARDLARARQLDPSRAYEGYSAVLDDVDVDIVYVSLSNEAHLEWVVKALHAGKHVVCEKPLTLSASECATAFAEATSCQRILVEATWTRWHPRHRRAAQLVADGAVGGVRAVDGVFAFDGVPAGNYRLEPDRGGGALLDVGPYLLWPVVDLCDGPATAVECEAVRLRGGIDLSADATLKGAGWTARLHAAIDEPERQELAVTGQALTLTWDSPAHTNWHERSSLVLDDGTTTWTEYFAPCDAYRLMVDDISRAVMGEHVGPLPGAAQSVATAELIDRIAAELPAVHGASTGPR